jgi:OOP family OmpA-OmpF porin
MRRIITLVLVALVVSAFVVETAAAGRDSRAGRKPISKKSDEAVTNFVYDVTIPWPFRHRATGPGDVDGDGVADSGDRCPGTPRGAVVDESGCPLDSDGDGVYDGIDKCPGTRARAAVNEDGCPTDKDKDGVLDNDDRCPGTPKDATVDRFGCPSDSDGDGVYDGIDRCPETPQGTRVDKKGCPLTKAAQEMLDTGLFATTGIVFDTGKADIKPESRAILAEIGEFLVEHSEVKVEVGGHTDSEGPEDYNRELSRKRAESVVAFLLAEYPEIEREQLTSRGYGEGSPIASNDAAAGRAKNRRVEFKVIKQ